MNQLFHLLISICLGLLLGGVLGGILLKKVPQVYKGPNSAHIKNTIYLDKDSNQYYQFDPIPHICPPSCNIDNLEHSEDD